MIQETDLQQKLNLIETAKEFEKLVETKGWRYVCDYMTGFIQTNLESLEDVDTSKPEGIDALRRWQIGVKFVNGINSHIERILEEGKILRGEFTLNDPLLMEKLKNEQPDPRPDPAGY